MLRISQMGLLLKQHKNGRYLVYLIDRFRLIIFAFLLTVYVGVLLTVNLNPYILLLISYVPFQVTVELILFLYRRAEAKSQRAQVTVDGNTEIWFEQ